MIKIPILKIILASFALLFTQFKYVLEISIFPIGLSIPFLITFFNILPTINTIDDIQNLTLGINFLIYSLLFLYSILSIHISLFRLTSLGPGAIHRLGIVPPRLVFKLFPYFLFVQGVIFSVSLLRIPFLEPIVFMLLAHVLLKFVSIATSLPTTDSLQFIDRLNIAIIQFIIPIMLFIIVSFLHFTILIIVLKVVILYFGATSLGLIFNNLNERHTL